MNYWIPLSNDTHYEFSSSRTNQSYIGSVFKMMCPAYLFDRFKRFFSRECALAEYGLLNKTDPKNVVDCGDYACYSMLQVYRYFI